MTATAVPEPVLAEAAKLLARTVGLRLDPVIQGRLSRCLLDDAAAHGVDVSTYVAALEAEPARLQTLLDRVTVQETSFFRDPNQFVALRDAVLTEMPDPVTIWSAGCANGQEAYTLAMTLAAAGRRDWRVIASDISNRALARTRQAQYSAREMAGVTPENRTRFFTPAGADWRVVDSLRQQVDVVHHNLVAAPPPLPSDRCDIVFCRNVLIYFQDEDVAAFVDRLARWLRPGGWLFLGYSESLWQVTDAFQLVRLGDAFAYRRRGAEQSSTNEHRRPEGLRRSSAKRATEGSATRPRVRDRVLHSATTQQSPKREPAAGRSRKASQDVGGDPLIALAAVGSAALNVGDPLAAVTAFRKRAYLEPDEPIAHLHLGLALDAAGDFVAARRAYGAARRALTSSSASTNTAPLEGYDVTELERLLDAKLSGVVRSLR